MRKTIFFLILTVPVFAAAQAPTTPPSAPQTFKLPATPKTVAWGYYDAPPRRCCAYTPVTPWCLTR